MLFKKVSACIHTDAHMHMRFYCAWRPVCMQELMLLGPAREMHCAVALCRLMDWRDASCSAQALAPLAQKGKALLALSGLFEDTILHLS